MPNDYPYPTPYEMLRFLLRSFDLKLPEKDKKRLDDMAAKRIYDPREFKAASTKYFTESAEKYIGRETAELISNSTNQFLEDYLQSIAGKFPADGMSREFLLRILSRTTIRDYLVKFALAFQDKIGGPQASFWFSSKSETVDALFSWLSDNEPHWNAHLAGLNKEHRDMISAWRKGENLPSSQSLYLLSHPHSHNNDSQFSINWNLINPLLFLARSIDSIKQSEHGRMLVNGARLALLGAENKTNIGDEIRLTQAGLLQSFGPAGVYIAKLQFDLRRTIKKTGPEKYRPVIQEVRKLIDTSEHLQNTDYWIDWHDARWHVFSGDLKTANILYKSAFKKSAFVAGENQKHIAEEAIVVAACQPNPDKVFLKQIKWIQILFGYDIPSITSSEPSQKVYDNIEEWEIDLWRSSFDLIFPEIGLFPGIKYKPLTKVRGPLILSGAADIKPDYRHPNRMIKVGATWQRAMPQLVWFALAENVEVCRNLIEMGADVNVKSEVGDTPILMALEALNVTEFNINSGTPIYRSLNDETFKVVSSVPHDVKTINTRTQKRRLLPIISAVESGRLDVVTDILEMGADPNGRGKTDEQTALNICLKLIGILKHPKVSKEKQLSMPLTPEAFDSIRRGSQGLSGFTLDQQKQYLKKCEDSGFYEISHHLTIDTMHKNIHKHMNVDEMRVIASLLIDSGANVNAEFDSPIKGYTPLMLTAEMDERAIFEKMLICGGDIKKTYKDPRTGRDVSLLEIAKFFKSKGILQVLEDISSYVAVH